MSTISSVTTPAITTPTTAAKPAEPAQTATPTATAKAVDAFEQPEKALVNLAPQAAEEADPFADCEFDEKPSGGGGIAALDPSNGGGRIPA